MNLPIVQAAGKRPYPPRVSQLTATFWSRLAEGRFCVSKCGSCGRESFPPKAVCPGCWSDALSWTDVPGQGVIYSWTRIHAAPAVFQHMTPYAVGIVDLDHGLRLACLLVASPEQPLGIGGRVELIVLQFEDGPLFAARTTAGGEQPPHLHPSTAGLPPPA